MEWSPKVFFFLIISVLLVFFVIDISYQSFLFNDMNKSLENASKGGIQQSINKGQLRALRTMSIDTDRFGGFYDGLYVQNQSVKNTAENTTLHAITEQPPVAVLESTSVTSSYFLRAFAQSDEATSKKKEIVIIEKK